MADGEVIINTEIDNSKAQKQLNELGEKIKALESDLKTKTAKKSGIEAELNSANAAAEKTKETIASLETELKRMRGITSGESLAGLGDPENVMSAMRLQDDITISLQQQRDTLVQQEQQASKIATDYRKISDSVSAVTAKLDGEKAKYGEIQQNILAEAEARARAAQEAQAEAEYTEDIVENTERAKTVTTEAERRMRRFNNRIRELTKSALMFSVLTAALTNLRQWLGRVVKSNDEAAAAIARLKGSLLTLAQPIVSVIIPAFVSFINVLTSVINAISAITSALFGTTIGSSADAAEQLNKEQEAIEGVGGAASKAEKQLAGFDEINKLVANNAGGGGGGAGIIAPDFSGIAAGNSWLQNLALDIAAKIREFKFDWDEGKLFDNRDAWNTFLSGALGAIVGGMFGGLKGAILGLLLGLGIGIISATFTDKLENPELAKKIFTGLLISMLSAAIGFKFYGLPGAVLGFGIGLAISILTLDFYEDLGSTEEEKALFNTALRTMLFMILGAKFGGLTGAGFGLLLGITVGIIDIRFNDGMSEGAKKFASGILYSVLFALIGALIGFAIGGVVGGIAGGVIALTLGLAITINDVKITNAAEKIGGAMRDAALGVGSTITPYQVSSASVSSIPALASGAVIPPNQKFLAVLGDQKSGTNVEAPLSTIQQAVRSVLSEGGYGGNQTVILELDGRELGRATYKVYNQESQRLGAKLGGV